MKNKKNISDLIRDNQHKLDERPSARTWERLESKLDNQRSKGHTFLYRKIAMAAAVVALIAVISLIKISSDHKEFQFAQADKAIPSQVENWIMQDLETIYTDASTNIRMVVEFQKELKDHYTNPIEEGAPAKKLLASNKTFTGSVNRPDDLADKLIALNQKTTSRDLNKIEEAKEKIYSSVLEAQDSPVEDVHVTLESEENINKPTLNFSRKNKSSYTDDVVKNYLTLTQQMEWILGAWRENNSLVEWQKVNKSTILCDEFILKEKKNIGLHLIEAKTQDSYALISEEGNKLVFSNKNSDRIILEKINRDKFTMTLLPAKGVQKTRIFTK